MIDVRGYNLAVLIGMLLLAAILGALNNLRVDDDRKVHWFGGPMVPSEEEGATE